MTTIPVKTEIRAYDYVPGSLIASEKVLDQILEDAKVLGFGASDPHIRRRRGDIEHRAYLLFHPFIGPTWSGRIPSGRSWLREELFVAARLKEVGAPMDGWRMNDGRIPERQVEWAVRGDGVVIEGKWARNFSTDLPRADRIYAYRLVGEGSVAETPKVSVSEETKRTFSKQRHVTDFIVSLRESIIEAGGGPESFIDDEVTLGELADSLAQNGVRFYHDPEAKG